MKAIGKVMLTAKGDYDPLITYEPLDLVRHNHKSWISLIDGNISVPSDTNPDWQLYTEDGIGIVGMQYDGIDPADPSGLTDLYTITFSDGNTFTLRIKNGKSGAGTGDMDSNDYVNPQTGTGIVLTAREIIDVNNNVRGNTAVLVQFGEDASGKLTYKGNAIGGSVTVDNVTIEENASGELQVTSDITDKLSDQILGIPNGNFATFIDPIIGGSDFYLASVFCSDLDRYQKSKTVSGNTLTVEFDDDVTNTTCILQVFKKI